MQSQQSSNNVSVKKKKRILKTRNLRPIMGTVKILFSYSLGMATVIGATTCVFIGINALLEALAPAAICAGLGASACLIGKSGYEDLTGTKRAAMAKNSFLKP